MKVRKNYGFTLIEILVVIGIISVIAGMLVPQFVGARNNAHNSAAELYARNLTLWLASSDASKEKVLPGSLTGSCLSTELQAQGAPDAFPRSVLDCEIAFEAGHYQVKVTSASKKGGPTGDGVFINYY